MYVCMYVCMHVWMYVCMPVIDLLGNFHFVSSSYFNTHPIPIPTYRHTWSLIMNGCPMGGRGEYMIISRFSQSHLLLISGAPALSLAFATENIKKSATRASRARNLLSSWASLKFTLFAAAIIQVCRLKVTVVHNPTYLTEFLKKLNNRVPVTQLNKD